MPTLPTYNSGQNINTQPAGVERNQAAQPFKDIQNVIGTMQDVTQKLSDANDVMQETKAKTTVETALAQQEQAAQNDPNPDNAEAHLKAVQDIVKNAPKIDNQELAGRVGVELQQSAFLSGIKIQDLFKKKQMFANDVALDQLATTASQNKANAVSPAQGKQDEDNFMATVQKNVNTGLITPQRGMELAKQFNVGVVKTRIAQNTSENPDDYKGLTDGLDIKESSEVQKMIAGHIKQVEEKNTMDKFSLAVNTLNGVATNKFDWKNLDNIKEISKKYPDLGSALQMVSEADGNYEPTGKEAKAESESAAKIMEGMTVEQVNDYLINAVKQKDMTSEKLAILVNAAQDRASKLPPKDPMDIPPELLQQEGGVQAILRWNKEHSKEDDPQTVREYLKNLHAGKSSHESYNAAIKMKIIKDHPEVASQKDVPNRIINNDSKSFHIFSGETNIYPARIWNESLGRFEINPNREQNDNSSKQTDK